MQPSSCRFYGFVFMSVMALTSPCSSKNSQTSAAQNFNVPNSRIFNSCSKWKQLRTLKIPLLLGGREYVTDLGTYGDFNMTLPTYDEIENEIKDYYRCDKKFITP
mmetsp:Transcript_22458/g.31424  ORF Transcript_22458/g.31424 Transcript_22458/m.31424 type:complete len:105 (+) Transcript_22458:217-531(+)